MRKVGLILMPAFIFAMALAAHAQKVDTSQDRGDTLKITVTGGINLDLVFRNDDLTRAGAGSLDLGSSYSAFEGDVAVRLDIDLSEKIKAVVSLRTQRLTGGGGFTTVSAGSTTEGAMFVGTGADITNWGANPEQLGLLVDEASVTLNDVFTDGMHLAFGILPVAFDVRGKGSAFFFDPRHSSSITKDMSGVGSDTTLGFSDELQPTGIHGWYSKDALSIGVFLLPAVVEGGAPTDDESAYGVWFFYTIDSIGKGSRIGAIFSWQQFLIAGTDNNNLATFGVGFDWLGLTEGLELYIEIYFQFGHTDDNHTARGWAMQLGGQWNVPNNDNNIWVALNFKYISGDDDVTDDRSAGFHSYENVNDTLILEDQSFGLDLDTNYWTIQVSGGVAFTIGSGALKNNLELSLLFGFFKLANDVLGTSGSTDDIGHELDLRVRLWASKQVSFDTNFGVVFASDVFEDVVGAAGENADKTGFLWTIGTHVKF